MAVLNSVKNIVFFLMFIIVVSCASHVSGDANGQENVRSVSELEAESKNRRIEEYDEHRKSDSVIENNIQVKNAWVLPASAVSTYYGNWLIDEEWCIWVANYGKSPIKLSIGSNGEEKYEFGDIDSPEPIRRIVQGPDGQLVLIVGEIRNQKALLWEPNENILTKILLEKSPVDLAWSKATGDLWYIATDFSLNIKNIDGEHTIEGAYTGIVVSDDGESIGVGRKSMRETEDDFVVFSASNQRVSWSARLDIGRSDFVGFGPGESIVTNQIGYTTDDNPNRVINTKTRIVFKDGRTRTLSVNGAFAIRVRGKRFVFIERKKNGNWSVTAGELTL